LLNSNHFQATVSKREFTEEEQKRVGARGTDMKNNKYK
jgi:hypothetical protein